MLRVGWILALALASSCAPVERVTHLEGTWSYGFEENRFQEPGRQYEQGWGWCLDEASPAWDDLFANNDRDYTLIKFRVEIEGVVTGPSEEGNGYGHMGLCDRLVTVTDVVHSEVISVTPPPTRINR